MRQKSVIDHKRYYDDGWKKPKIRDNVTMTVRNQIRDFLKMSVRNHALVTLWRCIWYCKGKSQADDDYVLGLEVISANSKDQILSFFSVEWNKFPMFYNLIFMEFV